MSGQLHSCTVGGKALSRPKRGAFRNRAVMQPQEQAGMKSATASMQLIITDQYLGQRWRMSPAWPSGALTPRGPWESLRRPLGLRLSGPGSKLKLQTQPGALRTSCSYLREARWRNCKRLHPRRPLGFVHTRIYGVDKASPLAVISARTGILKTIHTWEQTRHGGSCFRRPYLTFILFWVDVGKNVVGELQEGALLVCFGP